MTSPTKEQPGDTSVTDAVHSLRERIAELEGSLDLMRDEFQRIKALTDNSEVIGLCDRAVLGITQLVPVLKQRDEAIARFEKARQWNELMELELTNLRSIVEEQSAQLLALQDPEQPTD
jgi:hypothetical protein